MQQQPWHKVKLCNEQQPTVKHEGSWLAQQKLIIEPYSER